MNLRQEVLMKNEQDLSRFTEAQAIIKDLQQAIAQSGSEKISLNLTLNGSNFRINIGNNKKLDAGYTAQQMLAKLSN